MCVKILPIDFELWVLLSKREICFKNITHLFTGNLFFMKHN